MNCSKLYQNGENYSSNNSFDRLVELNVEEQCINVIKTAAVQRAYKERGISVQGWVFDIRTGKLIDLKIDFPKILNKIMEIYKLE